MLELFTHAGVARWPLGFLSVLALAIILERAFTLYRLKRLEERAFMMLQLGLEKGDDAMLQDRQIEAAPVTRVVNSIVDMRGAGAEAIATASEIALSLQRARLRRYLGTLATIGSTSPFIGLFGTVLGVMAAFNQMHSAGLTNEAMASGISEALSATALGLLVAIPSVMAYNYYVGRVQDVLLGIHSHVARLQPLLQTEAPARREA